MDREKTVFEKKIAPILGYVGAIGATLMSIMYIVIVFILVLGFQSQTVLNVTIFAIINALMGLIIMQFLKVQGISFAKMIPENKEILDKYYATKTKDKKYRNIQFYWTTSLLKDIVVRGITVAASTAGLIYIVIQGCNDYKLLLLALVNLVMFICFGLLALNQAYEFYNNRHIPYILHQLEIIKDDNNRQQSIQESRGTSIKE